MDYLKHYIKLMRKRRRVPSPSPNHKHHVFPKSIYGNNDTVVFLTPREHFIAHILLMKGFIKRYGITHIYAYKMAAAARYMTSGVSGLSIKYTSRKYELIKNIQSENMKNNNPMFNFETVNKVILTKKLSPTVLSDNTRKIFSDNMQIRNFTNNPVKRDEVRKKISDTQKQRYINKSVEEKEQVRQSNKKAGRAWWDKMLATHTEEELKSYHKNLGNISKESNSKSYKLIKASGEEIVIKNFKQFALSINIDPGTLRYRLLRNKETHGFISFKPID